jgi:hypothetical protein
MPVLVRPAGEAQPQVLPDVGICVATWYAPDGSVWPLMASSSGIITQSEGVDGLGSAAITITSDPRARGGARVRHIQPETRSITWPLYIYGDTHMEFITRWRAVERAFTSTSEQGPGRLEIARPDGSARTVDAYYESGFDPSGKQGYYITSDYCVLSLFCEDPYWRDAQPQQIHREFASGVDFQSPYPSVSSSQVLGHTTLLNPGDVDAWPSWTMTGPASILTATRLDTGDAWTIDPDATDIGHGDLADGEYVTVDTDPPRVRFMDGSNWTAALDWPGAVLWSLPPGETDVSFDLDGAAAGSAVDLTFYPRYKSA